VLGLEAPLEVEETSIRVGKERFQGDLTLVSLCIELVSFSLSV